MTKKTKQTLFLIQVICFTLAIPAYNQTPKPPIYFLDSIEIDFDKVYLMPESIESMFVKKESIPYEIYIYSKNPPIDFLTLQDLIVKYTEFDSISSSMLFFINGKMISDIDGIVIDKNFFIYLDINNTQDVNYIRQKLRTIRIISIHLEREPRKPVIRIRGAIEELIMKEKYASF